MYKVHTVCLTDDPYRLQWELVTRQTLLAQKHMKSQLVSPNNQ